MPVSLKFDFFLSYLVYHDFTSVGL